MESVRLELEMDRVSLRADSQRDSGLPNDSVSEECSATLASVENGGGRRSRRLSFNSLDSGVVEEGYDVHA